MEPYHVLLTCSNIQIPSKFCFKMILCFFMIDLLIHVHVLCFMFRSNLFHSFQDVAIISIAWHVWSLSFIVSQLMTQGLGFCDLIICLISTTKKDTEGLFLIEFPRDCSSMCLHRNKPNPWDPG